MLIVSDAMGDGALLEDHSDRQLELDASKSVMPISDKTDSHTKRKREKKEKKRMKDKSKSKVDHIPACFILSILQLYRMNSEG